MKKDRLESTLSAAQERYVECIADAEAEHGHAHVSLMAASLGVSKPSVVQMTARLVDTGIVRRNDKEIALTGMGRRIARNLGGRHALLRDFMQKKLGMSVRSSDREACRLEHVVSRSFVCGLEAYMRKE